jgi:N-acetylglucosaminyldiphosphoundecaprenol N-acetyl-beta-D-mannosaminyltransferase
VAEMLATRLKARFPELEIAGTFCPPFRVMTLEEEEEMIREINESNADVIWVGLGLLKQERWIETYRDRLNVPWLVGVGAAFDYHAGTARWAPAWIRGIGFEWLYRLYFEPRMLIRNIYSFIFLLEAMKDAILVRMRWRAIQ